MEALMIIGVFLFVVTEALCAVALLTPDWVVSNFSGQTKLGLAVSCYSTPGSDLLCEFPIHHPAWAAALTLITLAMVSFGASIVFLVVSLRGRSRGRRVGVQASEKGGQWSGLIGVMLLCAAGIVFPAGFDIDEINSKPYLLPEAFGVGYSYIFFNLSILSGVVGEVLAHRLCLSRTR